MGKRRGKPTIASQILKDVEATDETGEFLVFYDMKGHPSEYFYKNLHRIIAAQSDGGRIQASVISCGKLKTAKAIYLLAKRYDAEVLLYRAERIEDV